MLEIMKFMKVILENFSNITRSQMDEITTGLVLEIF